MIDDGGVSDEQRAAAALQAIAACKLTLQLSCTEDGAYFMGIAYVTQGDKIVLVGAEEPSFYMAAVSLQAKLEYARAEGTKLLREGVGGSAQSN